MDHPSGPERPAARPRRRGAVLLVLSLLAVLVVGTGVLAGLNALSAARSLEQARAGLLAARAEAAGTQDVRVAVTTARAHLAEAERRLSRPPTQVTAAVPVLGRSLAAERAVVQAADDALAGVAVGLEQAPDLRGIDGGVDVTALQALAGDLEAATERAERSLAVLRSVETSWTPSAVGEGVRETDDALGPVVSGLREAVTGARVASGILGGSGDRQLLVALENNAELRGTGGFVSTFATGVLADGRVALQPVRDVVEVTEAPALARAVPAPAELVEDYGRYLAHTTVWRNWNMTPDVPQAAEVGARVAGLLLGTTPDVVLMLDVPAMSALVALGGGEVELEDGTSIPAEQLSEALLVDSYAGAGRDVRSQDARRAALRNAATRAVTGLLGGDVPPLDAVRLLGRLADERHLKLWSARAEEQAALVELGVAGSIDPGPADLSLVTVNNLGGNKLDYYVDRDVEVEVELGPATAEVVQRVRFENQAPADLVPYVAGLREPGTVFSLLEMSMGQDARLAGVTVDGRSVQAEITEGPGRLKVRTDLTLPRGASTQVEVRYQIPVGPDGYTLHLVPQPLAVDAALRLEVRAAEGHRLGEVQGAEVREGTVSQSGPFPARRTVTVRLQTPR